jgi:hypothetical protein
MTYEDPPYQIFQDADGFSLGDTMRGFMKGASVKTYGLAGLQGLTSVAGLMSRMAESRRSGQSALDNARAVANDEMLNATQAYVSGVGQSAGLKQKLADTLGARFAGASGSGVDAGSGVVQANARDITGRVMSADKITRGNAEIASRRHQMNAIQALFKGAAANEEEAASRRNMLRGGILQGLLSAGRLFL